MKLRALLLFAALLVGCHPAPRALVLPTTAAVRAPLVAAQVHVARAVEIGKQESALAATAQTTGIAAGSEQARQLAALVAQDQAEKLGGQNQLTAALYQTGTLQKELDARQAQIDALAKHDAKETAQVGVLDRALNHRNWIILALVVLDYLAGAPIQHGLHTLVSTLISAALGAWKWVLSFALKLPFLAAL